MLEASSAGDISIPTRESEGSEGLVLGQDTQGYSSVSRSFGAEASVCMNDDFPEDALPGGPTGAVILQSQTWGSVTGT